MLLGYLGIFFFANLINLIFGAVIPNTTGPEFRPGSLDDPKRFFNKTQWTRYIRALPTYNEVMIKPFSGDYWPWRYGGISARYGKMDTRNKRYITSISMYSQPGDYLANRNRTDWSDYVNRYYSAAEKYDLLMGDYKFTLTRAHKNYGSSLGRSDISSWMGMCHGLAPASYMVPTPYRAVNITAPDGTRIQFLPDDIKALGTAYWAFAKFNNRMTGRRTGFMNPASFFLIMTNWIGRYRLNAAFAPFHDMQIWNMGLSNYTVKYYNIMTRDEDKPYSESKVTLEQARGGNNFARSLAGIAPSGTAYIVGAKFTVGYVNFQTAKHVDVAPPREIKTIQFTLALFLDEKEQIFYGAWTSRKRPSYIWGPDPRIPVLGPFDNEAPRFVGQASSRFTEFAEKQSAKLMPLRSVTYHLARVS
jgi:hypothetical protein